MRDAVSEIANHSNLQTNNQSIVSILSPPARLIMVWCSQLLVMLLVLFVGTSLSRAETAPAEENTAQQFVRYVTPGEMTSGALLLRAEEDGKYLEAPILATDVDITVSGPIVRATITQRFENPADAWVEGVYVFPLPEGAAVDTLKMQIGDRLIDGVIKEREEARRIYEQAREDGRKASLVEQERPNMFTNSVANIGPGETVIVQIEYQETVDQSSGIFSLRFPMVVGPRYNPAPQIHTVEFDERSGWGRVNDPVPDRDRITPPVQHPDLGDINPVALTVSLNPGFALGDITSAFHEIDLRRTGNDGAILTFKEGEVPANKDFELTWTAKDGDAPTAALFRENVAGDDYALLFLTPPLNVDQDRPALPREVIFVIDNSGSMSGPSIVQAKDSLLFALGRLTAQDRFNVIRFDNTMEVLFPTPVLASERNVSYARGFVSSLDAAGGTEMLPALRRALSDHAPGATDTLRQVIFLTDGAIGNEEQMFREISRNRGRSRVFTVGIGSAPNSFFMNRAAEIGRGTFTHIGDVNQVRERMSELFAKLENPVLTDIDVAWAGGEMTDISPAPVPDLYLGEPIVLTARAKNLPDSLKITGTLDGAPWSVIIPLDKATAGKGLGKLWARRHIASLEADRSRGDDASAIDRIILTTALGHHIVSRLTSLVAVDVTPSRPGEEPVTRRDVPLNLPDGWNFEKVFGDDAAAPQPSPPANRRAGFGQRTQVAQLLSTAPSREEAEARVANAPQQILLPQTATPAERQIMVGILLVLFAMTCLFLRHMWGRTLLTFRMPSGESRRIR